MTGLFWLFALFTVAASRPTITIGFIGTTFNLNEQLQFVRSEKGAQHLAAFMMAVVEINTVRQRLSFENNYHV